MILDTIEMGKKGIESKEGMFPDNKGVIEKSKTIFWIFMLRVEG